MYTTHPIQESRNTWTMAHYITWEQMLHSCSENVHCIGWSNHLIRHRYNLLALLLSGTKTNSMKEQTGGLNVLHCFYVCTWGIISLKWKLNAKIYVKWRVHTMQNKIPPMKEILSWTSKQRKLHTTRILTQEYIYKRILFLPFHFQVPSAVFSIQTPAFLISVQQQQYINEHKTSLAVEIATITTTNVFQQLKSTGLLSGQGSSKAK